MTGDSSSNVWPSTFQEWPLRFDYSFIYLEECWHWWKLTLSHCCWDQLLLTCQDCLVDLHGRRSSLTKTSWPLIGRCWQTSSFPHLCQCWLCSNCFLMIQETLLQPKILNILSKWITCIMLQVILGPKISTIHCVRYKVDKLIVFYVIMECWQK